MNLGADTAAQISYFLIMSLIEVLAELPAFTVAERKLLVRRALDLERFRAENVFLKEQVEVSWAAEDMFLALPSMQSVRELMVDTIDMVSAPPWPKNPLEGATYEIDKYG